MFLIIREYYPLTRFYVAAFALARKLIKYLIKPYKSIEQDQAPKPAWLLNSSARFPIIIKSLYMKLSEALMERADKNRKLQELKERIIRNAKYQEGDKPPEDPESLLEEYESVLAEFEALIVRINITNNSLKLEDGTPMIDALAKRDVLKLKHSLYKSLASEATPKQDRYSKKEIKFISSVSVKKIQKSADKIAKEYRNLDAMIQQANWNNDLI